MRFFYRHAVRSTENPGLITERREILQSCPPGGNAHWLVTFWTKKYVYSTVELHPFLKSQMRETYVWRPALTCRAEAQRDTFLDQQKACLVHKSQPELCQVCDYNLDMHSMRYMLIKCDSRTCSTSMPGCKCRWRLKVLSCDVEDAIKIYLHGSHLSADPPSPRPNKLNRSMKRFVQERAAAGDKPAQARNALVLQFGLCVADPDKLSSQVAHIVRTYRASILHDNDYIDEMVKLASEHRYRDELHDTIPFAFGFALDDRNQPILGKGTDEEPLVVGFATKATLRRLDDARSFVLHLDATFKINTKGYPVIVIGISDMWRQFHPVCFFLVSDLKQPQWQTAIRETILMYQRISGCRLRIDKVMMDADDAQRSAFEMEALCLLEAEHQPTFLMCFFHVMTNVRKRAVKLAEKNKQLVYRHVYRIHYARSQAEKQTRIKEAVKAWQVNAECQAFSTYFVQQWLTGRYTKWQCIETATGVAKTNNPVENFNRQLKNQHTMRRLLRLNALFLELLKVIRVRALLGKNYATSTRSAPHILRDYRKLASENRLVVGNSTEPVRFFPGALPRAATQPRVEMRRFSIAYITMECNNEVNTASGDSTASITTSCSNAHDPDHCHVFHLNPRAEPSDAVSTSTVLAVTQPPEAEQEPAHGKTSEAEELNPGENLSAVAEEAHTDQSLEQTEQPTIGWCVNVPEQSCTCRSWFKLGCCVHVMAALAARGLPYDGKPPPRESFP